MSKLGRAIIATALILVLSPLVLCMLLLVDSRRAQSSKTSPAELDAILHAVPLGSDEAQTLASLRAHGIPDHDIRILVNAYGFWGSDPVTGAWVPRGNEILAHIPQPQPKLLAINSPPYMQFTFKFNGQGLLDESYVNRGYNSPTEYDRSFPPGGNIVSATPPPAR